jgi:sugar phosphate isomerase/epimerase
MNTMPTRRHFIASAIAAGSAVSLRHFAHAEPPPSDASKIPCTLGFGTYGMKSLKTEDALRALLDIGFDSILLACMPKWDADPATLSAPRRADLRRQLADSGLRLTGVLDDLHPGIDAKANGLQSDRLRLVGRLGHDLAPNQPVVFETTLGGKGDWTTNKPVFLPALADWVKVAEAEEITIAVKPHRGTPMSRPEQAIELFSELGKPARLRMCYDYSHFVHRDMPLDETIRTSLPWTSFITMKDAAIEDGKAVFKLPGETGEIDYPALLSQFYHGGYRGDFNCEVSSMISRKPGYDPIAAAKTCYANMAPAFVAAGVPRPAKK